MYFCLMRSLINRKVNLFVFLGVVCVTLQGWSQSLPFLLEQTIRQNFSVRIAKKRIARQQGLFLQQAGQFNWVSGFSANISTAQIPLSAYDQEVLSLQQTMFKTDGLFYQATGRKQFATGQELFFSLGVQYQSFSYLPGNGYRGDIRFTVAQPLLQGFGKKGTYANVAAQRSFLKTEEHKLKAEISYRIYLTLENYIRLLSLRAQAKVITAAEKRYENLLVDIQELAESGKVKQSDILPTKASLANQQRRSLEIEIKLNEVTTQLALGTGLKSTEIQDTHTIQQMSIPEFAQVYSADNYLKVAEHNRFDLKSIENQLVAYNHLLSQARQLNLPKLDLTGSVGLTGQTFRFQNEAFSGKYLVQPLYSPPIGPNFMAGISLTFPPQRDFAKGKLVETKSLVEKTQIDSDYLKISIGNNINMYLKNLELVYKTFKKAQETVSYYQQIIENEQIKLTLGKSTILDLLYAHNILIEASIDEIQAKTNYLLTIAGLRYECGMLVYFTDDEIVLYPKLLTELPVLSNE